MKKTVSEISFIEEFKLCGREEQFTRSGLSCLYEYLNSFEEDTGEEIEFDVVAICCDFCEYGSEQELLESFSGDYSSIEEYEQDGNLVIRVPGGGFIISNY